MVSFVKSEEESRTDLDKVFFMLKNMSSLKTLPRMLNSGVFQRFFQLAKYAKLTKEEQRMYDISLKRKWDAEAVRQFREEEMAKALQDGLEKGLKEGLKQGLEQGKQEERAKAEAEKLAEKLHSALKFKKMDLPVADIVENLGLTVEQVEKLK